MEAGPISNPTRWIKTSHDGPISLACDTLAMGMWYNSDQIEMGGQLVRTNLWGASGKVFLIDQRDTHIWKTKNYLQLNNKKKQYLN